VFPQAGTLVGAAKMDMPVLARIREQILPVTVAAVVLAVGCYSFNKMPPVGTIPDMTAWILLFIVFCALFSIFPAIAIICGWYTGNRAWAVLAGVLPFPLFYSTAFFLIRSGNMVFIPVRDTILFIVLLSAVCGLVGYCAAQRTKNYLAVSIILTGIWLIIWMSGFN
jgi:hypothetical protein